MSITARIITAVKSTVQTIAQVFFSFKRFMATFEILTHAGALAESSPISSNLAEMNGPHISVSRPW
jgi:hypothetical protein